MLVLSRREGESIVVPLPDGEVLRLVVVQMRGDNVRLGFEAPDSCKVWRQEVFDAHIAPQLAAQEASPAPAIPAAHTESGDASC